jgi:heptaprenyl diphosphate synthase
MLAMVLVLSAVEHTLPPLLPFFPGLTLGLANVLVMYTVFFIGGKAAIGLSLLKALFVFLTRGAIAGLLSLSGGVSCVLLVIVLLRIFKDKISYITISVLSAITFNVGQLVAASFIVNLPGVLYYLPVAVLCSVVLGAITGIVLKILLPVLNRADSARLY